MTINLDEVGATVSAPTASGIDAAFGIYLPGISQADGYEVLVRLIHHDDRFRPEVATMDFPLASVSDVGTEVRTFFYGPRPSDAPCS